MSLFKRGNIWWYEFWFAGRRIQESSKSTSKTIRNRQSNNASESWSWALMPSKTLVSGTFSRCVIRQRNTWKATACAIEAQRLQITQSGTCWSFWEPACWSISTKRLFVHIRMRGSSKRRHQRPSTKRSAFCSACLGIGAKSSAQLKRQKALKLKVRNNIAKVYSPEEKAGLLAEARRSRSPNIYPVLMLAQNAAMRSREIRTMQWKQIDFQKKFLVVGESKTEAGEGRTIPLNSALYEALVKHAEWFRLRFGRIEPDWYLFPFGKSKHLDPTRPVTTLKTAWRYVKERANVQGRLHDSRHTLITELAESGVGDQTIMDIAGHVSKQMLKHYSHIRMRAKREALESVL